MPTVYCNLIVPQFESIVNSMCKKQVDEDPSLYQRTIYRPQKDLEF